MLISLGFYIIKFFIDNQWKQIIIDDFIPFLIHDSNLAYSRPKNKTDIGLLLIEIGSI